MKKVLNLFIVLLVSVCVGESSLTEVSAISASEFEELAITANVLAKALLKRVDIVVNYFDVRETYPNQGVKKYIKTKQYTQVKTKYYGLIAPTGIIY